MSQKIIKEIMNGNGNNFTIKEILSAHIKDGRRFEECCNKKFDKIFNKLDKQIVKVVKNETRINSISRILKYGIAPIVTGVIIAIVLGLF